MFVGVPAWPAEAATPTGIRSLPDLAVGTSDGLKPATARSLVNEVHARFLCVRRRPSNSGGT